MHDLKLKVLDKILSHLSDSQGSDLKTLLEESRKPKVSEVPPVEGEEILGEKPKGLKIESVEVMEKPKSFDDKAASVIAEQSPEVELSAAKDPTGEGMTDEELEELLKQLA